MSRPEIMTPRELADLLRVSEATVRANAASWGGFRVGKQWRFREDVVALLIPDAASLLASCPDANHPSPSPNDPPASGASDGASMAGNARSEGMRPATKRRRARGRSATGFAEAFPEYATSARSRS